MSKKVDERVVEMRFDNQQFESGVKTTMSTLDKLKAALKFPSSSKSLDNISKAAKNVDFSGMQKGIETVNARFSALQVVGMTALSNITSAAMRAGSQIVNSFTFEPIISGFREYETQLNAVQTIMANTSSKGTTLEDVTAALDELNTYADQTIYNFTEMTRNIGTFTAAGVDLETSVSSIKGIANLAAVSGSTSAQASTAMYQLSQAIAAGKVQLMDWNSVVNAGMGGEVFQNALKRTATVMGKDVDALIKKYGSFRESLTRGDWLTTDVLTETLKQFTMAAEEGSEQWEAYKKSLMDTGYTEAQAVEILNMANTATDAATKVKTFTQLMDTLKEAMGSGWAKTWQLIFGDFEEAKAFWTEMSDMFSGIINNFSDARNNVIEQAMGGGGSRWGEFEKELKDAGSSVDEFQKKLANVYKAETGGSLDDLIAEYETLEKAVGSGKISAEMMSEALGDLTVNTEKVTGSTKSLAEWQKVVDDVWYGTYANIDTGRVEKLAAAGWEFAEVQKLVNMTVDGHRLTLEDLTEAQLISIGYTEEQSKALAALAKEASTAGSDMNTLINDLLAPKKSGRELFLEGIKNVLEAIMKPLGKVADAFNDVFAIDADGLYEMIKAFNEFSKSIIMSDEDAENLGKTFKGLFSIIKLISTGVGNTLVFAFKTANAILAPFGTSVLEITGAVGEAIYQFSEWITSGKSLGDLFTSIGDALGKFTIPLQEFGRALLDIPVLGDVLRSIGDAVNSIKNLRAEDIFSSLGSAVTKAIDKFKEIFETLKNLTWEDVLNGLSGFGKKVGEFFTDLVENMKEIGPNILEGLQNGLTDGFDTVITFLKELGTKIIEAICAVLGIHSPSTVFFEIGKNIVRGLVNGIKYLSGSVADVIYSLVEDIKYALSGIDWGVVLPVAGAVGSFAILYQMTDALQGFAQAAKDMASPMKSISNLGGSLKTTVDGFNNLMGFTQNNTSIKFKQMAEGVKLLAEAIAILAAAVAALTLVDTGKLWNAVGVIAVLAVIIGALAAALAKFATGGKIIEALQLNTVLLSIGGTFALLAVAAKILSTIDDTGLENARETITLFASVVTVLVTISAFAGRRIGDATESLAQIGVAFLLLGAAARLLGGMDASSMRNAQNMILTFAGVVSVLMLVAAIAGGSGGMSIGNFGITRSRGSIGDAIKYLSQIGKAFLLLGVAARLLGGMDASSMRGAQEMLISFAGVVGILMIFGAIGGARAGAATQFLSQVGVAFLALGVAAKLLGSLSEEEMNTAKDALYAFVGVIGALTLIGSLSKGVAKGVASSVLSMSLAIGILAGVAVLLSYVKLENMYQGVAVVTVFGFLVSLMAKSARGVRDVKGTMIGMAVAIGVMAAAVAVLSFIQPDKLYGAAAALGFLILTLSAAIASTGKLPAKVGPIIAMVAAVGVMAAAVGILAQMNPENVISSAVGLGTLMIALAAAIRIIANVKSISGEAIGGMAALTLIVGALSVIITSMNGIDPVGAIANATALGILINALVVATGLISGVKSISGEAIGGIAVLTLIVGALSVIIGSMNGLNPVASIANAISLGVLINALAFALNLMEGVNSIAPSAYVAVALLATIMIYLGTQVLIPMNNLDPVNSIANAVSLSVLINALAIAAMILGAASPMITAAQAALVPLGIVIAGLAGIVAALGWLNQNTAAQEFVKSGGAFLTELGNAIGGFVGGIVGGALAGLTSGLPQIGTNLSGFAENLKPFIETMNSIDPNVGNSLTALATGLAAFTGAGFLDNLTAFFSGGASGIQQIATNLPMLGIGLAGFALAIAPISDMEKIATAANSFKALAEAMATIPNSGGWLGDILGGKDYSGFAEGMESIGDGLVAFDDATADVSTDTIQTRVDALKTVMEALSGVPSTGGFLQKLLGEQNWDNYSTGMKAMGEGLANFDTATTGVSVETLSERVNALKSVMDVIGNVPSTGGLLQGLLGEQNFGNFSAGMSQIGLAFAAFSKYADQVTDVEKVNSVISSLSNLINALSQVPSTGGWIDTLLGEGEADYKAFANGLKEIGGAVGDFATSTADIADTSQLSSVVYSTKTLMEGLAGINAEGGLLDQMMSGGEMFTTFSTSLTSMGNAVAAYASSVAEGSYENVSASISAARIVLGFINETSSINTDGVNSFKEAVDTLAEVNVTKMIETFSAASGDFAETGKSLIQAVADGIGENTSSAVSAVESAIDETKSSAENKTGDFTGVGETIPTKLVDGIESTEGDIETAVTDAVSAAANAVRGCYQSFYSAGAYISQGLANGMNSKLSVIKSAASQMAQAAATATRAAAVVKSPSRVFMEIGDYLGQGLVIGMENEQRAIYRAGSAMGDSAYDGIKSTISTLGDILSSDLDVNPTIRPVLDLSDVKNGANSINGMLNSSVPMNVLGRVNSISRSMNSRIQNGSFSDVVDAVNKLRTGLSELSTNSYTINGITYDDGSNIAAAVGDLTRAIRLEGRV